MRNLRRSEPFGYSHPGITSATIGQLCEACEVCEKGGGYGMVGKSAGLSVGEVAAMLDGVHPETVRRYVREGKLRALPRLPGGHRRIAADSVDDLIGVMKMTDGPAKDAALRGLVDRNLGRTPPEPPNG